MCGIFGQISNGYIINKDMYHLAKHARQRGRDSSGFVYFSKGKYQLVKADYDVKKLYGKIRFGKTSIVIGHSRLVTNGMQDNQPVFKDGIFVLHNGIIVNDKEIWGKISDQRKYEIDTEVIIGLTKEFLSKNVSYDELSKYILQNCDGTVSTAVGVPEIGKMFLFSNNGSLYVGQKKQVTYFSSEKYPLETLSCINIKQVWQEAVIIDIPKLSNFDVVEYTHDKDNLIPKLQLNNEEENLLEYHHHNLRRCTKCILPETFPYISFDDEGVCNYCRNYKKKDVQKSKQELMDMLKPYRRNGDTECIVPFSGGRDSCYALHIIVNELKMKPVTYTYDWGMVTDLARRNVSRMCSKLGVENIIVAADIVKKRSNIRKNLKAWLKKPHLGMVSLLTAGDKHFFKYIESIKKQTGINLNIWGTNPLETTHFKSGFLGVKPDFENKKVYSSGFKKQMEYQSLRFKAMLKNLSYFNSSIFDTLSGEYYRSFVKRTDYYHIYDYYRWEENEVNRVLETYGFEKAPDTSTTWRIGDGTAAFYNYIYYTVAGFTEHDTFRSNQIREGHISRDEALKLVNDENKPRYMNIRWYLDTLNMDYVSTIKIINNIKKMYL